MKCNDHHYCEDSFCRAIELAIASESSHPVPYGDKTCPRLEFKDVKAMLFRSTTIPDPRRDNLLQKYAHPPALASSFTARPTEPYPPRAPTS
jgi:hypothetical protein